MPNIFFTSDTHFGHERIIKYCKRPSAPEIWEGLMDWFDSQEYATLATAALEGE